MKKLTIFLAFLLFVGFTLQAQMQITGTVTGVDDGLSVPGVSVVVKDNQTIGTTTDMDGKFILTVPSNTEALIFSFVGMKTQEELINGRSVIDILLEAEVLEMDAVVVTALGIKREKKSLGYSVQDVKSEELTSNPTSNIVNALTGKVAGVQVTSSSGAVGASSRMVIRGASSLAGNNQPLFVVDGVPISNAGNGTTNYGYDGADYGNAASDINPNDIESITVLKGGAAALYGSRAASGVVLITTKSGKTGKKGIGVEINQNLTFDHVANLPDYQNEWGQGLGETFEYVDGNGGGIQDGVDESWGPKLDDGLLIAQFDSPVDASGVRTPTPWISHPDNVKDFFEQGINSTTNIAITSTSEKASTRFSIGYQDQTGVIPNTDQTKINFNLNTSYKFTDKLTVDAKVNYIDLNNNNLPAAGYDNTNVMNQFVWFGRQVDMASLMPYKTETGQQVRWNYAFHDNPYWIANEMTNSRYRNRAFGVANVKYELLDWMNVVARIGTDFLHETRKSVQPHFTNDNMEGYFDETFIHRQETNADLMINIDKELTTELRVSAILGANYMDRTFESMYMEAPTLTVDKLYTITNVKGNASTLQDHSHIRSNSVYAQASFSYKNFVYLDGSIRNDWSSTLAEENYSFFYPSISASVLLNDAISALGSLGWLSYAKLRGGWARVGNGSVNAYDTKPSMVGVANAFNGITLFRSSRQQADPNLTNETTDMLEVGLEAKFFQNRLGLDFAWYKQNAKDQILSSDVAPSSGVETIRTNAGEVQNTGVEVILYMTPVQTKDFTWDIAINYAKNNSEVISLADGVNTYEIGNYWGLSTIAKPGVEYGAFWGLPFLRNDAGDLIVDANGAPQRDTENVVLGKFTADWVGGIRNDLSYKGINLGVLVDAKFGGDIYSVSNAFGCAAGVLELTLPGRGEEGLVIEGVKEDGTVNDIEITSEDLYHGVLDRKYYEAYIYDASYIKLREISLGYTIPSKWLDKTFLKGCTISAVGRNLAILYKNAPNIDPETGFGEGDSGQGFEYGQIPATRSYGFNLKLNF